MSQKIVYESWTFPADKIREGNLYLATSLLSSSLEVNTLSATVECADPSILDFQRNAQLLYYAQPDRPMVFRVQDITRVAPSLYELSCTSTLGLLTEGQHMGGIYTGQTAGEIISDICGNVPFIVKSNLVETKLYGWLPIASPRDNLSQVLFALGAALKTDLDGVLRIEGLWDGISGQVSEDDMYIDATADYSAKVTQVIVTEHQYSEGGETMTLFEGTAQEGDIITFDAPMYALSATGISILGRGANWARVSSGTGTLTGKEYIHNTRLITRDVQHANIPNVKTIDKATLISLVNSAATADRLVSYFKCKEIINSSVVYRGENTGNIMSTYHPFDKTAVNACVQSADITLSNTLKAEEKCLVGFVPLQHENAEIFNKKEIISRTGIWIVQNGVTRIRAVLIGGGQGGGCGYNGQNGEDGKNATVPKNQTGEYYADGGKGGSGGTPGLCGHGGKILIIDLNVNHNDILTINVGTGGKNNEIDNNPGQKGGETTLEIGEFKYTSENGSHNSSGYTDEIFGGIYAIDGINGIKGGNGGDGKRGRGKAGDGESVNEYIGGRGGYSGYIIQFTGQHPGRGGLGGGGAAYGNDGENSLPESDTYDSLDQSGGSGANAKKIPQSDVFGCGGNGGCGGGGGGGGGGGFYVIKKAHELSLIAEGSAGREGGVGSKGEDGNSGCVILYYSVRHKIQAGRFVDKNGKQFLEKLSRRFIV